MRRRRADRARRPPVSRRRILVVSIVACVLLAAVVLRLDPRTLAPREGGLAIAGEFLRAAVSPALDYEALPAGLVAEPFLARLATALGRTILFAAAALTLALPFGLALGVLCSASWWERDPLSLRTRPGLGRLVRGGARTVAAALRSVHELLFAVLFLAAFGLGGGSAVLALAVPLVGTLGKVFAEILDEADGGGALAARSSGSRPSLVFLFGRFPAALPDLLAYTFYRFECAVRTSAVLGFFGFPTLGSHLRASFEENHYREVWSYLFALLAVVLLLEAWSGALRRRFVA